MAMPMIGAAVPHDLSKSALSRVLPLEYCGWIYPRAIAIVIGAALGGETTIAASGRCLARRREKPGDEIDGVVAIS